MSFSGFHFKNSVYSNVYIKIFRVSSKFTLQNHFESSSELEAQMSNAAPMNWATVVYKIRGMHENSRTLPNRLNWNQIWTLNDWPMHSIWFITSLSISIKIRWLFALWKADFLLFPMSSVGCPKLSIQRETQSQFDDRSPVNFVKEKPSKLSLVLMYFLLQNDCFWGLVEAFMWKYRRNRRMALIFSIESPWPELHSFWFQLHKDSGFLELRMNFIHETLLLNCFLRLI